MVKIDTFNQAALDRCLIRSPVSSDAVTAPPAATLGLLLFARLRAHDPNWLFMEHAMDSKRRVTYGELLKGALGLAHGLVDKIGLKCNNRVAIVAPNHELYFMIEFACLFAGLTLVPMVPEFMPNDGPRLMADTQPHAVIVHSSLYESARKALDLSGLKPQPHVILLDSAPVPGLTAKDVPRVDDLIVPGMVKPPMTGFQAQLDDTAIMTFTSGTTSATKIVQVTHRMVASTMVQMHANKHADAVRADDKLKGKLAEGQAVRYDCSIRFYHLTGTLVGVSAALRGCAVFYFEQHDAGNWLAAVQRHKITHSVMFPRNLIALIKDERLKQFDISSLVQILSVSAPLSGVMQQHAMDILGIEILQAYGSSEALAVAMPRWGKHTELRPGTIGWLKPGMEALMLDPATKQPLPIVENGVTGPGELVVFGASVMSNKTGYFNRPVETAAAFIEIGGRSWYQMGDLVIREADGCMRTADRSIDTFTHDGQHVVPTEIESQLYKLHGVVDAVAVPIPVPGSKGEENQMPCAAVVPKNKAVLTDKALQQALTKEVVDIVAKNTKPHMYLIGGVVFIEAVPRNAMGKIFRKAARTKVMEMLGLPETKAN
ncbi:hypothetical protein GGF32_008616 [Allomyces javanicus]|nr:hypothetical protein GGF32_008616 [Allomyces javanicus]